MLGGVLRGVVDLKTLDDCVCDWLEKADVGIWTLCFRRDFSMERWREKGGQEKRWGRMV